MVIEKFQEWIKTHKAGDHCVYHRGDLASDRQDTRRGNLDKVATLAFETAQKGRALLSQKRLDEQRWEYILTLRKRVW